MENWKKEEKKEKKTAGTYVLVLALTVGSRCHLIYLALCRRPLDLAASQREAVRRGTTSEVVRSTATAVYLVSDTSCIAGAIQQ